MRAPRLGMVGTFFEVPNGAFPIPWGPEQEEELRGSRMSGPRLGQVPIASGFSWNTFAEPIGQGFSPFSVQAAAAAPPAAAPSEPPQGFHCYVCQNPPGKYFLSEGQAQNWNERFDRQCVIDTTDPSCAGVSAAPPPSTPVVDVFSGGWATGGVGPATFEMGTPGRFEGVSPEEYEMRSRMAKGLGIPARGLWKGRSF